MLAPKRKTYIKKTSFKNCVMIAFIIKNWFQSNFRTAVFLSFFILNPVIFTVGTGGASGDNAVFDVNTKSDTIYENECLIPRPSIPVNQNDNSMVVYLVVNLPTIRKGCSTDGNNKV